MPYRVDGDLTTYVSDSGAASVSSENYNELITKYDNLKKYTNYLAEHIEKLMDDKIKTKEKEEIFMIFYINVDGLSRRQVEEQMEQLNAHRDNVQYDSYKVNNIIIPVKIQPTKVEIVNPSITNGDIIKSFKDLVDTLDDNKYRELIEKI